MQQLKPQDAQFLYAQTARNLPLITGCTIYDSSTAPGGEVNFAKIMEHIRSRIHASPLFTQRLKHVPLNMDFPYWVEDEHFNLENHVSHGHLLGNGDWEEFCDHLGRYHSKPLDMNRPLWEIYIITGLKNIKGVTRDCFAVVSKVHHCAVDGTSGMHFYATLCDIDNQGTPAVPIPDKKEDLIGDQGDGSIGKRALANTLSTPFTIGRKILDGAPALLKSRSKKSNKKPSVKVTSPDTRFNVKTSPHKVFNGTFFPFKDFQQMRKLADKATINDVVLTVCGGALRKYLSDKGELPETSLVAMVPVNTRPKDGDSGSESGNQISSILTYIHSDIEDPVERLEAVSSLMREKKQEQGFAGLFADVSQALPAPAQKMFAALMDSSNQVVNVANMTVSNVPGPKQTLYFCGAKGIANYGMAPLADGCGLFIGTPSMGDQMCFTVTSTRDIMPDSGFFIQCVEEAHAELKRAARSCK